MISMERPTVGCQGPVAAELTGEGVGDHAEDERAEHHRDGRRQDDRDRVRQGRVDRVLAGGVETEDGQQPVEEADDEGRAPHRVVAHPQERLGRRQDDALEQVLPVQAGADRAGGRGGAGAVGVALVVGVLADRERLGVARVVGRVRVVRDARGAVTAGVGAVAEVLGLAVTAVAPGTAVASVAAARGRPRAGAAAVAVRRLLRVRLRRLRVAVRRPLRRLLSVRGVLRSRVRSAVVVPAASDPESSHAFERTWSRAVACRGPGFGRGIAAEL
ncbi:hypothetical protein RKD26_003116 [Streptomyces calvus]